MIAAVSGAVRWTSFRMSIPSTSARRRSVSTTSNWRSLRSRMASVPLVTASTSCPSIFRIASIVVATLASSSTTSTQVSAIAGRSTERKRDRERRALAFPAAHAHRPAMPLHDAVRDPETKTRAALGLRREERLEDPALRLGVHAHPAVPYLDADGVEGQRLALVIGVARRHRQRAAVRHGLDRG